MEKNYGVFMSEQWKQIKKQLSSRVQFSLSQRVEAYQLDKSSSYTQLILTSSSDFGVCRNGGRRGAQFAPEAILNILKKTTSHNEKTLIGLQEISNPLLEQSNFDHAQQEEIQKIKKLIQGDHPQVIHLGGGHDHVYPFALAISQKYPEKGIHIVNIDAHLDTRDDSLAHSGTPFRQLLQQAENCHLYQIGIHPYANPQSNYEGLSPKMSIIHGQEMAKDYHNFSNQIETFLPVSATGEIWLLSVDLDGLHSSFMEAVSAVNHNGLDLHQLKIIINTIKQRDTNPYLGLYEYNPIFDNLSQKGVRAITDLLIEWME